MADKLKGFFRWFDVPSGSILGIWSGVMITLTCVLPFLGKDLPENLMWAYVAVVGAKTGHGIMAKGQQKGGTNEPPQVVG
jgi:hypothetical protein